MISIRKKIEGIEIDTINDKINLMERSCPRCKKKLTTNEFFFCLNCGYKLEDQLIYNSEPGFEPKKEIVLQSVKASEKKSIKLNFNKNKIVILSLVLFITILLLFFIYLLKDRIFKQNIDKLQTSTTQSRQYLNTLKVDLDMRSGDFYANDIALFVPFDSIFYMEGYDFDKLVNYTGIVKNSNSVSSKILPYIAGHFAFFGKNIDDVIEYGGAFVIKDVQKIDLDNLDLGEDIKVAISDNYLIIASNQDILDEMLDNKAKIQRSIVHNPKFSSNKSLLDKNGELIFMYFGDEKVDEFVRYVYNYVSNNKLSETIDNIIINKFDKFVLKD